MIYITVSAGNCPLFPGSINRPFCLTDHRLESTFYSIAGQYIMKHFLDKVQIHLVKINSVPTFRIYQKDPLPVNMAVHINKLEMHDKSVDLLSKNS